MSRCQYEHRFYTLRSYFQTYLADFHGDRERRVEMELNRGERRLFPGIRLSVIVPGRRQRLISGVYRKCRTKGKEWKDSRKKKFLIFVLNRAGDIHQKEKEIGKMKNRKASSPSPRAD